MCRRLFISMGISATGDTRRLPYQVCSYDRAGLGWSKESPLPRSAENIVKELHALLHTAGIPEPYILVGHSIGGINMRLYANTYPDEVYGVVLVDSSHELQEEKIKEANFIWPDETPSFWERAFHWLATTQIGKITGLFRIESRMSHKEFTEAIPESIREAFISRLILPSASRAMAQERAHFEENFKLLKNSKNLLEDKPLIVISRGKATSPTDQKDLCPIFIEFNSKIWQPLQKDLVAKSKKSKQLIAEKSCHMIPFDQPEIIVDAVKALVEEYKGKHETFKAPQR